MKNCRMSVLAAFSLAAGLLVSCGKSARINGEVEGLGKGEVIVKLLDVNTYKVLDADVLVMTENSLKTIDEILNK